MRRHLILALSLCFLGISTTIAQETVTIKLISESVETEDASSNLLATSKAEITSLLQNRYNLKFEDHYVGFDIPSIVASIEEGFSNEEVDLVIALGPISSAILANRNSFGKPGIASIILDHELQEILITGQGSSGIENFTYIETPFDIERDLKMLHEIVSYQTLGIIGGNEIFDNFPLVQQIFSQITNTLGASIEIIPLQKTVEETMATISNRIDAVYALPLFQNYSQEQVDQLFEQINQRKIPSAALIGDEFLARGAFMGYLSQYNLQRIPRRIALDVMKILEGVPASSLPVEMDAYTEELGINMATSRRIGVHPNWDILSESIQFNIDEFPDGSALTLKGAIAEALQRNLGLRVASADPTLAQKDIDLAIADLFPQVDISSSYQVIDDITALSRQGSQGQFNWLAGGSFSQVVLSEPTFANVAIQRLLKKSAEMGMLQTQLDLVIDVSTAYLNYLQAKSNLDIQLQNVEVTRENYHIAKAKEAVGYSGASDLYRWEAQLASANIDLNDAVATLDQTRFQINQLLNRPIEQSFQIEDVSLEEQMIMISDERLDLIDNYGQLVKFANFLVDEAMQNLPELGQFDANIAAQERLALSQKRAFYLPSVALSGSANMVLSKSRVPEQFTPIDNVTTWDISVGLQFPILQGGARKHRLEQTKVGILQLKDQRGDLRNQLEQRIRSNIASVGASYSRVELSRKAADASLKNFAIVQDSYSAGQVNIVTLIDAQTNSLQTELSALNAVYSFVLDFLNLERSIGGFYFMSSEAEKNDFFTRMNAYVFGK